MEKDVYYKEAQDAHFACMESAGRFYMVQLNEIEKDHPDIYEKLKVEKAMLVPQLIKNKCIGTQKYLASLKRKRVAEYLED